MSYESKVLGFLQTGYELTTSSDEKITVAKSLRVLRINTKVIGKFLVGDSVFQKRMFDATVLSGITLATTSASTTSVVESYATSTFIKGASSSNYAIDTTGKILSVTASTGTAVITSNSYTVAQATDNYLVVKVGTITPGNGSVKLEVSLDAGLTFQQVYANQGVFIGTLTDTGNFVFRVTLVGNAVISGGIGFVCR